MSKIIRNEPELVANIELFVLHEKLSPPPDQDEPETHPESSKIIRHAESSALAIRPFVLFATSSDPVQVDRAPFSDVQIGATESQVEPWSVDQEESSPTPLSETLDDMEAAAQAAQQAALILAEAREEAERYVAEARERATAAAAKAYEEGFRQGTGAAREEITAQFASLFATFQHAAEEIINLRTTVLHQAEEDVITLAFQLARKIVPQEVLCKREVLANTLQRALDHLVDWEKVVVRVNPADLEQALEIQKTLPHAATGAGKNLTIKGEEAVGRGGCVVESAFGDIDACIETQLEEMERRFREQHHLTSETETS